MKKTLFKLLLAAPLAAAAQAHVPTEKLILSGDPTQIASGYLHCGAVMSLLGNAAIKTNPDEGAGYIKIAQKYWKLYGNTVDMRIPDKKREFESLSFSSVKRYGEMAQSNARRPLLLADFTFCEKWSKEL